MLKSLLFVLIFLATALSSADAAKRADTQIPEAQNAAPVQPPAEAMVMLEGKPLFPIKANVLSFSPSERAKIISERISTLVKEPFFRADNIKAIDGDTTSDIVVGDKVLMSITESDAFAAGKKRSALAQEYALVLQTQIAARTKEYSARSLALGIAYAIAATLLLIVVMIVIGRLVPKIVARLESWKGTYIRSLRLQSIEVIHQDRIVAILSTTVKTIRFVIVLVLLNFYVPLVMTFFPWTRDYSAKYLDYIINPLERIGSAIISYLPNVFFILVILGITYFVIKFTRFLFSEIGKRTITIPGFFPEWAEPTFNIARFLIVMFALVVVFPYLPGSDSPAFKGVSVFLGVLLSLGSSSAISNIVAGVILTYTRAFKLGDRIQIGETVGDVVESNLLVTRIRTIKHVDITVPNAMVLSSHITNFSSSNQEYGLILHTTVTIGYDAPWRQVHELLIAAAKETENVLVLPAPFVLQTSLDDFFVSYQINAYTDKPAIMACTYSLLHQNIQDKFNEAGVEIMSPHFSQLRDGNTTTIPGEYLPADYKAPAFRVNNTDKGT